MRGDRRSQQPDLLFWPGSQWSRPSRDPAVTRKLCAQKSLCQYRRAPRQPAAYNLHSEGRSPRQTGRTHPPFFLCRTCASSCKCARHSTRSRTRRRSRRSRDDSGAARSRLHFFGSRRRTRRTSLSGKRRKWIFPSRFPRTGRSGPPQIGRRNP